MKTFREIIQESEEYKLITRKGIEDISFYLRTSIDDGIGLIVQAFFADGYIKGKNIDDRLMSLIYSDDTRYRYDNNKPSVLWKTIPGISSKRSTYSQVENRLRAALKDARLTYLTYSKTKTIYIPVFKELAHLKNIDPRLGNVYANILLKDKVMDTDLHIKLDEYESKLLHPDFSNGNLEKIYRTLIKDNPNDWIDIVGENLGSGWGTLAEFIVKLEHIDF